MSVFFSKTDESRKLLKFTESGGLKNNITETFIYSFKTLNHESSSTDHANEHRSAREQTTLTQQQ